MKKAFLFLYILVGGLFLIYLALPARDFPTPPFDSVQSMEEADTETIFLTNQRGTCKLTKWTKNNLKSKYQL